MRVPDADALAERCKNVEALVLLRERTPISAALVARLPKLRLITISGPYPNIDVAACTAHGIAVCASVNRASMATPELTWGLIMATMRHIPGEVARLKGGAWQHDIGRVLHGRRLGILRLRPDRQGGGRLWPRLRHAGADLVARARPARKPWRKASTWRPAPSNFSRMPTCFPFICG